MLAVIVIGSMVLSGRMKLLRILTQRVMGIVGATVPVATFGATARQTLMTGSVPARM